MDVSGCEDACGREDVLYVGSMEKKFLCRPCFYFVLRLRMCDNLLLGSMDKKHYSRPQRKSISGSGKQEILYRPEFVRLAFVWEPLWVWE